MAISYSGYSSAVIAGVNGLVMNFDTNGTMPDTFQAGDILVAAIRSDRPLSGSSLGSTTGWTVWNGTSTGQNAMGLFYKRFTTAADFTANHRFDGWSSGGGAVGVMTCFRGINASVSATSPVRNGTGLVPARTDTIRPNVDLSVISYVANAAGAAPEVSSTGGATQGVSRLAQVGSNLLMVGLAHRENPIASDALTSPIQFGLSEPVIDPRYFSLVMRGAGQAGPPTGNPYPQPFHGLYVGGNPARMHRGGVRIF